MSTIDIFKALGDASRLKMLAIIAREGPISADILCERLKLVPSTISHHASKLLNAELIQAKKLKKFVLYSVNQQLLNQSLSQLVLSPEKTKEIHYREQVLKTFINCGKLIKIPSQRKKRRVILEQIIQEFDTNRQYQEKEVNALLNNWHEDHCFLRRELVSEKLLSRDKQIYQRVD